MKLSPHFTLSEFLFSETASRLGREVQVEDPDVLENLRRLCTDILEPLRAIFDRPIIITSGYRPPWLNAAVGGSLYSDHMLGCAADIRIVGISPLQVCRTVERSALGVRQCIHEFGAWTHLSCPHPGEAPRRECLTAIKQGAGTVYLRGIHPVPTEPASTG